MKREFFWLPLLGAILGVLSIVTSCSLFTWVTVALNLAIVALGVIETWQDNKKHDTRCTRCTHTALDCENCRDAVGCTQKY